MQGGAPARRSDLLALAGGSPSAAQAPWPQLPARHANWPCSSTPKPNPSLSPATAPRKAVHSSKTDGQGAEAAQRQGCRGFLSCSFAWGGSSRAVPPIWAPPQPPGSLLSASRGQGSCRQVGEPTTEPPGSHRSLRFSPLGAQGCGKPVAPAMRGRGWGEGTQKPRNVHTPSPHPGQEPHSGSNKFIPLVFTQVPTSKARLG